MALTLGKLDSLSNIFDKLNSFFNRFEGDI